MEAAATCKLALVVLSNDFFCSKWPMTELCAFLDAQSSSAEKIKILPIFYRVSPYDLKLEQNRQKWRMIWEAFAEKDPTCINVTKWERALDTLGKLNGITFDPSNSNDGELSYIQKILSSISSIIKPLIKYDVPHVRGRQRLCEIICGEFMKLECGMPQPSNLPPSPKVCVLGMYGLPGSGKSTLSKCLCNHYARQFKGRTFYLELPTNPNKEQLVEFSKRLLKQITDFSDMVDLDNATNLDQVYSLLRRYLQRPRVFLVVDNILPHDLATEFVQRILMFNFKPGSKVLLVCRNVRVLQRFCDHGEVQKKCREEKCKYTYGSVRVPSINKEEAIEVLLQSAKDGCLSESCAPKDELDPKDRVIVERVIRMSGFGNNYYTEYLPMVVKIMGAELRKNNLEKWGNAMEAFWKKVELSKEDAVMELVNEIFDKLPQHLQLLFLDVALFILPQSYDLDRSVHILSIMHSSIMHKPRTRERIQMDMAELQRHCFLESDLTWGSIRVHDVFLEFAKTCPESCMYYSFSHEHCGPSLPNELPPPSEQENVNGLRAVVLELNEEHERFDFWEGFSSVKALVLRNCTSLRVLGFPVGFTSLRVLDIHNCPQLTFVEAEEVKSISNSVGSFTWNNQKSRSFMAMQQSSIVAHSRPPPASMEVGSLALKMRWLQDLRLTNTGIKRLEDLSKCWPLLRQILIDEAGLQYLKVGKLPNLEAFDFSTSGVLDWEFIRRDPHRGALIYMQSGRPISDRMLSMHGGVLLAEKDLLAGCPNLRTVRVLGACMENGLGLQENGMLQTLDLGSFWDAESFPDLAKATQSLTRVYAWDCPQLTHVNFNMHRFQVLEEVILQGCPSLVQVHALDHLVSLRHLSIAHCAKLQTVSGLSGLVRLEDLEVRGCDSLERLSGVKDLVSLQTFIVGEGCSKLEMPHSDLQNLTQLAQLCYYQHAFQLPGVLQLSNFVNLSRLDVFFNNTGTFIGLGNLPSLYYLGIEEAVKCEEREVITHEQQLVDVATLLGVPHLSNLEELHIKGVHNLASLNGITLRMPLTSLTLQDLPYLTRLSGIETLVCLKKLTIEDCESIEELPSLSLMLELEVLHLVNCSKLKSLDGCNASQRLQRASLTGCKEMEHFPLSDTSRLELLRITGSKFASNIETLVQWVVASATAHALRAASLWALEFRFREAAVEGRIKVMVVETLGVELINRLIPKDDDSFDSNAWTNERLQREKETWGEKQFEEMFGPMGILVVDKQLLGEFSGKSKRWLKEQLGRPGNTLFKERLIACLAATDPRLITYVLMPWVCEVLDW